MSYFNNVMPFIYSCRRPDVTVMGEDVIIVTITVLDFFHIDTNFIIIWQQVYVIFFLQHTASEKDPVPLSVHHMPICVTFAFYNEG